MRLRYSMKPQFLLTDIKDHPVARKYYDKYNKIDSILESNSSILDEIHKELEMAMNTRNGRVSTFSTETLFRMLLVKCIERFTFRELIIRVNDSTFLRNFTRIGWGDLMGTGLYLRKTLCHDMHYFTRYIQSRFSEHNLNIF